MSLKVPFIRGFFRGADDRLSGKDDPGKPSVTMQRVNDLIAPVLLAGLILFLAPLYPAAGPASRDKTWNHSTYYSTIRYQDDELLYEFGRRIGGSANVLVRDRTKAKELIAEKVDRIVYRVRSLLDMHPPGFHFNIYLHGTMEELKGAYMGLGQVGEAPVAFYHHRTKTVHLTVEALTEGILAHEISHAVINSFYDPPLPARMQEILSQYVDRHLWDE